MATGTLEALHVDGVAGRLFCVLHRPPPGVTVRGAVLHFHAFAEEMNRARRMVALQAAEFARRGFAVLLADAFGCGDSDGEFSAADWSIWLADGERLVAWFGERTGQVPILWGLRSGCLLAAGLAHLQGSAARLLMCHPVTSGKLHLQQFLRLRTASAMLGEGKSAADGTRALRERLAAGESIEVAGYRLSPGLAAGLEGASLGDLPAGSAAAVLEVASTAGGTLSPAVGRLLEQWKRAGVAAEAGVVTGPAFWQTVEIETAPALIERGAAACEAWVDR